MCKIEKTMDVIEVIIVVLIVYLVFVHIHNSKLHTD